METLHHLIHSLAKEEKRLYSVHGRKARFSAIYQAYSDAPEFSRELDREIFDKEFGSFTKAYYSMQKNDLLDDLLGVLLEHSNSRNEAFSAIRTRSKFEVLRHKGFYELAAEYLRDRLPVLETAVSATEFLRFLEDFRDTLADCPSADWEEYQQLLNRIALQREKAEAETAAGEGLRRLKVLIASRTEENADRHRTLALAALDELRTAAGLQHDESILQQLYEAELAFHRAFDSRFEVHQFLVRTEKQMAEKAAPITLRLRVLNQLLESCLETGDFLLINGLTYKTNKEINQLTPEQRREFMPQFTELSAMYHFYENDLPLAQQEIQSLLNLGYLTEETLVRLHRTRVSFLIAANLPRAAQEALNELVRLYPSEKNNLRTRYSELIIAIEFNQPPAIKASLARLKQQLRKMGRTREAAPGRKFLEAVETVLARKKGRELDLAGLESNWRDALKVNLWLRGKMENNFYYNMILQDWQNRRKVLPAERFSHSVA